MADESIPGFTVDPELEELLDEDPYDLDEETRLDVQLYKSRKLQAKRDAGMSESTPSWTIRYPGKRDAVSAGNGQAPAAEQTVEDTSRSGASDDSETTLPGREDSVDAASDGDEALMEYYESVKSGSGTPRRREQKAEAASAETGGDASASAPRPGGDEISAGALALVREWVQELEDRLDDYHRKIVDLEEENAALREELASDRD